MFDRLNILVKHRVFDTGEGSSRLYIMQRYGLFAPGEHYHLLGRGNYKQKIFLDERDYARFLFLILHLQSPRAFPHVGREVTYFVKHRVFDKSIDQLSEKDRCVRLVNFCLMPNHFHLTVEEVIEGGISRYMQRVLNGFTKYHNVRYEKKGHLFEGPFRAVHVKTNEQLLYLSAYIHRNPRELKSWFRKEHRYPWSSYQDYIGVSRWGDLIDRGIVLDQFKRPNEYRKFVESSSAKKIEGEIEEESLSV